MDMIRGGNPTWLKYLEEKMDDKTFVQVLISNIPRNLWIAARVKAITKGQKISAVMVKLVEKWVKNEIEV